MVPKLGCTLQQVLWDTVHCSQPLFLLHFSSKGILSMNSMGKDKIFKQWELFISQSKITKVILKQLLWHFASHEPDRRHQTVTTLKSVWLILGGSFWWCILLGFTPWRFLFLWGSVIPKCLMFYMGLDLNIHISFWTVFPVKLCLCKSSC